MPKKNIPGLGVTHFTNPAELQAAIDNYFSPLDTGLKNLFQGTLWFVQLTCDVVKDKNYTGNPIFLPTHSVQNSDDDIHAMIRYAQLAAAPIQRYTSLYGQTSIAIRPDPVKLEVTVHGDALQRWNGDAYDFTGTYGEVELESWVNQVRNDYQIPNNDCVVIANPCGYNIVEPPNTWCVAVSNSNAPGGPLGYHGAIQNGPVACPFIWINTFGTNLEIADPHGAFAPGLSHEMAEMAVDPLETPPKVEVCDPCTHAHYAAYFDGRSKYLQTLPRLDTPSQVDLDYKFYIAAIAHPGFRGVAYGDPSNLELPPQYQDYFCNFPPPPR